MTPAQIATLAEYNLTPLTEKQIHDRLIVLLKQRPCRCGRTRRPR